MKTSQRSFVLGLIIFFIVVFNSQYAYSQSCATGIVDERVLAFLKTTKSPLTLAQLNALPIKQLKADEPIAFVKLPEDSVKRIQITKDNIKVNVVKASGQANLPVIINFHPGGFVKPLLPSMEYEAMRLAKKFNAVVFDVDYRVAPEFKFPSASNDAYAAYTWVLEHAKEYGGDPTKVILSGMDAGANLVALVSHKAKKENKLSAIKALILICAPVDNPMISYYDSYEANAMNYYFTKDLSLFYIQSYLDKKQWFMTHAEMWPFYEKDFSGLPPSLILTTEFDVLRDEGIAYGKKLEKAGVDVSIKCIQHQLHNFTALPATSVEMQRVYELMGEVIVKGLSK